MSEKTDEQRAIDALLDIAEADLCERDRIDAAKAILEHARSGAVWATSESGEIVYYQKAA